MKWRISIDVVMCLVMCWVSYRMVVRDEALIGVLAGVSLGVWLASLVIDVKKVI